MWNCVLEPSEKFKITKANGHILTGMFHLRPGAGLIELELKLLKMLGPRYVELTPGMKPLSRSAFAASLRAMVPPPV